MPLMSEVYPRRITTLTDAERNSNGRVNSKIRNHTKEHNMTDNSLEEQIGEKVTLEGTAQNSKAGAVLLLGTGNVIWIRRKGSWDDTRVGKEITLTGILRREKYIPNHMTSDDGGISQGAEGLQYTLELTRRCRLTD